MKKLTITKQQYDEVKEITANNCFAKARDLIAESFKIDRDVAYKVISAVYYNYKYLQVIEG